MRILLSLAALMPLMFTINAYGFGANGHRVVGEVATHYLSPEAQHALEQILDGEPLAFAATWPDDMRSSPDDTTFWSYSAAANWHFVNLPAGKTYEESEKNNKGDAYVALNTFIAILDGNPIPKGPVANALKGYFGNLKAPKKQKEIKQFAVKFIVHIIGDIHQPLHSGHASDRGGNSIKVKWFKQERKLHSVWDTELIESQNLSFTEVARKINRIDPATVKQYQASKPIDWLHESIALREQAYDVEQYHSDFSYDYTFRFVPLINSQLLKGGIRTAGVFNQIFSGE